MESGQIKVEKESPGGQLASAVKSKGEQKLNWG